MNQAREIQQLRDLVAQQNRRIAALQSQFHPSVGGADTETCDEYFVVSHTERELARRGLLGAAMTRYQERTGADLFEAKSVIDAAARC